MKALAPSFPNRPPLAVCRPSPHVRPMPEDRDRRLAAVMFATLSMIHAWFDWEWGKAVEFGRKGVEVEPSSDAAWAGYAWALAQSGKLEESIEAGRRFLELDPLEPIAHGDQGVRLFSARRPDEALPLVHRWGGPRCSGKSEGVQSGCQPLGILGGAGGRVVCPSRHPLRLVWGPRSRTRTLGESPRSTPAANELASVPEVMAALRPHP